MGFLEVLNLVERLLGSRHLAEFTAGTLDTAPTGPGGAPATFVEQVNDDIHEDNILAINALLHQAFDRAARFKATFEALKARLLSYRTVTQAKMRGEVEEGSRDLQRFDDDWAEFESTVREIEAIVPQVKLGNLLLDVTPMKEAFLPFPEWCIEEIRQLLPELAFAFYQDFVSDVHRVQSRLARTPATVEDFVDFLEVLQDTLGRRESFDERNSLVRSYYDIIDKFGIRVDARQRAAYQTLSMDFQQFVETLEAAEAAKDSYIVQFTGDLDQQEAEMTAEASRIRNAAQEEVVLDADSDMSRALGITGRLVEEIGELKDLAKRIVRYRQLFKLPENRYPELEESALEVELKHLMWQSMEEWENITADWEATKFKELEVPVLEETLAKYVKQVRGTARYDRMHCLL